MGKRIQRKRTKGWRMPSNTIFVGRPTKWGNPFSVDQYGREKCIVLYRDWLRKQLDQDPDFLEDLRGKDLACWCPLDKECHVDVLLQFVKHMDEESHFSFRFYKRVPQHRVDLEWQQIQKQLGQHALGEMPTVKAFILRRRHFKTFWANLLNSPQIYDTALIEHGERLDMCSAFTFQADDDSWFIVKCKGLGGLGRDLHHELLHVAEHELGLSWGQLTNSSQSE